jgi:protein-S-isoprenylcysteine O-methyltransferase
VHNRGKVVLLLALDNYQWIFQVAFVPSFSYMAPDVPDALDTIELRFRQREAMLNHPLQGQPQPVKPPGADTPPLVVSTIAFLLGGVFALGALTFSVGGFRLWWTTYQLGFFVAAWAGFHWGEFAVTAGWNLEKCNVDCK